MESEWFEQKSRDLIAWDVIHKEKNLAAHMAADIEKTLREAYEQGRQDERKEWNDEMRRTCNAKDSPHGT